MTKGPSISTIIPALNEAHHIERAVRSAADFEEVIVVDGGSDDATAAIAESAGAKVIVSDRGRGLQLRVGAAAATGDYFLILHADNWLAPECIAQLRDLTSNAADPPDGHNAVFGCFRQRIDGTSPRFRWLEWGNAIRARRLRLVYGDQAMFIDRQSYEAVGGFDSVPLMEDVILSKKLTRHLQPILLPGPVHISARRWQNRGLFRQTFRNWCILAAFACGVSPERLVRWYR